MIFSRKRGSRRGDEAGRDAAPPAAGSDDLDVVADEVDEVDGEVALDGPYDVDDAPTGIELFDLGSLRIPAVEGVEVRVQADPEGHVQQVVLVSGNSALQLGAFAAPRTEDIWDEVRDELRAQLRSDGFASTEVAGEYGPELRAKVRTPEGPLDLRFVGVSGPRWLVRAVFQGPVALDPAAAPALVACLRGVVVHRGGEAMPAREALPLRLPREIAEQAQRSGGGAGAGDGAADGAAEEGQRSSARPARGGRTGAADSRRRPSTRRR